MSKSHNRKYATTFCSGIALLLAGSMQVQSAFAQGFAQLIDYDDLVERLSPEPVPDGSGVVVAQIESMEADGDYGPNQLSGNYPGKSFFEMSGPAGLSAHADFVARQWYGEAEGIATGITDVYLWEAVDWVGVGFLQTPLLATINPMPPDALPTGVKLMNHSWSGTFNSGPTNFDNEIVRRADFIVPRDDLVTIIARPNDFQPDWPVVDHSFNAIVVGEDDGAHIISDTLPGLDVPGRMKPEIVGPAAFTSFAAPWLSAGAAILIETARTDVLLAMNPNAQRSEVIKAVILASANHREGWTNNPQTRGPNRGVTARPLDNVFGAGLFNINYAHMVLTGGEQDGPGTVPAQPNIANVGWALDSVATNASRYYRFEIPTRIDEISFLATWHRQVADDFESFSVADFDLQLWRIGPSGQLQSLVGNAGLGTFEDGNVVSNSRIDNLEHLFMNGLAAGQYVLEVERIDTLPGNWDVAVAWRIPEPPPCPPDLDGNFVVNGTDLLQLLNSWGACPGCPADITGDGVVNGPDLLLLLNGWGVCPQ